MKQHQQKNGWLIGIILALIFTLQSCSNEPEVEGGKVITIKSQSLANQLYYSGIIQPLSTLVVPSPADGVVIDMLFQYGEPVKANQPLFKLSSTKFLNEYKTALMQYIKAKNDFNNNQTQLSEATFLHKNQLISDDDYKMKKSNFYGSQLALLQAKDVLENLLHQLNIKENIYDLTIADIDKITKAMHLQLNSENLGIFSPAAGVVLSVSKNEEENKKLTKGEIVKQGDVLAIIGDMSGLSVRIKVNELVVNQIKVGQKVKITGIAFPEEILVGKISRVDRQGEVASGGLPTFPVEVIVPKLTAKQQKEIHVGMSAKVEIMMSEESQIAVPLIAIYEKNSLVFLKKYNEKAKKVEDIEVKTGKTTMDSVVILSGIQAGDKIVVPN